MDLRDAIKLRKQYEGRFASETVVTSGEIVARNGSTKVPGVPNHYWVVPLGEGEPVAVYNRNVKATRPGLAVQIGYAPASTVLEILRTVVDANSQAEDTAGVNMEPHGGSHRVDGDDPLFVETRAITALLVYPTGQTGLAVHVSSYTYVADDSSFAVFPGYLNFDLSAHQPGSGSLLALVYLDKTTNTLAVAVGTAIAQDSRAFIPPAPALPADAIPAAFVRLGAGSTAIEWANIIEARDFLGGGESNVVGGGIWVYRADGLRVKYDDYDSAYAAATNGDIIHFGPGNYTFTTYNDLRGKNITIEGDGPENTVITSSVSGSPTFYSDILSGANPFTVRNITIRHTGGGIDSGPLATNQMGVVLDNVVLEKLSGSPTNGWALWIYGGSVTIKNGTRLTCSSGTNQYGLYNTLGAGVAVIESSCTVDGGDQDIYGNQAGSAISLQGPVVTHNTMSWAGVASGYYLYGGNYAFAGATYIQGTDKAKVSKLRASNDSGDALAANAAGYLSAASQPLVAAYLSNTAADVTGDGTGYQVIFDTEIIDRNSNYNAGSGTFTAPVSGKYLIIASLRITGLTSSHTNGYLRCITSNRDIYANQQNLYALSTGGATMLQLVAITDMDASDTARLYVYVFNGTKVVDVYGASSYYTYLNFYLLP